MELVAAPRVMLQASPKHCLSDALSIMRAIIRAFWCYAGCARSVEGLGVFAFDHVHG